MTDSVFSFRGLGGNVCSSYPMLVIYLCIIFESLGLKLPLPHVGAIRITQCLALRLFGNSKLRQLTVGGYNFDLLYRST